MKRDWANRAQRETDSSGLLLDSKHRAARVYPVSKKSIAHRLPGRAWGEGLGLQPVLASRGRTPPSSHMESGRAR